LVDDLAFVFEKPLEGLRLKSPVGLGYATGGNEAKKKSGQEIVLQELLFEKIKIKFFEEFFI